MSTPLNTRIHGVELQRPNKLMVWTIWFEGFPLDEWLATFICVASDLVDG